MVAESVIVQQLRATDDIATIAEIVAVTINGLQQDVRDQVYSVRSAKSTRSAGSPRSRARIGEIGVQGQRGREELFEGGGQTVSVEEKPFENVQVGLRLGR